MKIVLPLSGGMDSAVLLYKALHDGHTVLPIVYNYNQRHKKEIECALTLCESAQEKFNQAVISKFVDVSFLRDLSPVSSLTSDDIETPDIRKIAGEAQPKSYVPFRNMMFLSIALSYAESVGAEEVWHGATKVDSMAGYWDASPDFLPSINNLCNLNREHKIRVVAPLIQSDKKDIVKEGVEYEVPFNKTYTCYSGNDIADATTPSSSLRVKGFIDAGYKDPQQYIQQEEIDRLYIMHNCKELPYH